MAVGIKKVLLTRKYSSKILLFGEHLVLDGAASLAIPFSRYGAFWSEGKGCESLEKFYTHLESLPFVDNSLLRRIQKEQYYLESDIPRGYGLGSSGTLCAALYEYLAPNCFEKSDTIQIKELAQMENFFHGKSSGLDAFVVFKNKPVVVDEGMPKLLELAQLPMDVFLIDSGMPRKSKDLINKFLLTDKKSAAKKEMVKVNNTIVEKILTGNFHGLKNDIKKLSEYQFEVLDFMIVDSIRPLWKKSLSSDDFSIKLCGAGGGGFYLGFGDINAVEEGWQEKLLNSKF